ncbi:polysaccharide pyruvyl transferase family protein [Paracoccus liaowanqingii]|uniref:Polysaccharide pyruvyl transferase family protein n=1 Tax=Paracoccus liaowanqingii TaxID=2560053 RepID=A0A4Z1CS49_9RHOB|nr:polysaccharide pyruvyl transferase family protein [Paracoccus liaowanqingii]TGN68026.1 polysaccharide pyruvyl transferase family protein [Paracoccus liaowanqingii]
MTPFIVGLRSSVRDMAFLGTKTLYNRVGHNTGNLAFHAAIDAHLGGNLPSVGWDAPAELINSMGAIGVVPAANQVGAHADYGGLARTFEELKCRLVMIGLGAQTGVDGSIPQVPEGTQAWVRQVASRGIPGTPNISVRGPLTKKVLDHYGLGEQALVIGCPSLFINPDPHLGESIEKNRRLVKRIAVAGGHPQWKHLGKIEASLAAVVTATGGSYVGQSPESAIALTRGEAKVMSEEDVKSCRDYICPSMSIEEFIQWSERHCDVFFDIPGWMEHYRRFDLVIGTRIHGVMLALQAGIPGVCIAHDSRTLELCQTMMVPYVLARDVSGGISREHLSDIFQFNGKAFDENRRVLAKRYFSFLTSNDLKPVNWLGVIARI